MDKKQIIGGILALIVVVVALVSLKMYQENKAAAPVEQAQGQQQTAGAVANTGAGSYVDPYANFAAPQPQQQQ